MIPSRALSRPVIKTLLYNVGVDHQINVADGVSARRLVYSCNAPRHPYHVRKFAEEMGVMSREIIPLSERKTVIYFSRRKASHGRRVVEEETLIEKLKQLLQRRNKGEKLEVLDGIKGSLSDTIKRFQNVRAIIGAHGGALYNARFAHPGTLIMEFVNEKKKNPMWIFWYDSTALGHFYHQVFCADQRSDLVCRFEDILNLLDKHLGEMPQERFLHVHEWPTFEDYYPEGSLQNKVPTG